MAYAGGIGQEIDQLKDLSVQELVRRQNLDPSLIYTIALQERQKMDAAGARQGVLDEPKAEGTVTSRMEQELAQQTMPQAPVNRVAPGIQQQGQRSMQQQGPQMAQGPQMGGISGVPANNMSAVGRARGGIIGYADGGMLPQTQIPTTGAQQAATATPEQIAAFQARLKELNEAKANAFPQEKAMFQQQIQDLLDTTPAPIRNAVGGAGMARGGVVGDRDGEVDMEALLDALMMAESGGDPDAVGDAGEEGAFQIRPSTAERPGFGVPPMKGDRFDPEASRDFARQYLQAMIDRYDGDVEAGLIAYNAGFGNADKFIAANRDYDVLPQTKTTQPYVRSIMGEVEKEGRRRDFRTSGGRSIATTAPESYTEKRRRERLGKQEAGLASLYPPVAMEETEMYKPNLPDALTLMQAMDSVRGGAEEAPVIAGFPTREETDKAFTDAGLSGYGDGSRIRQRGRTGPEEEKLPQFDERSPQIASFPESPNAGIAGYLKNIGRQQQQRRDDFREAVPGAEAAVARAKQEKEDGGIGYLRRIGRLQEGAAQRQAEEEKRAAQFMAMLQQNEDMIAAMDPAENMPIQGRLQEGAAQRQAEEEERAAQFLAMLIANQNKSEVEPVRPFVNESFKNGGGVKRFNGEKDSYVLTEGASYGPEGEEVDVESVMAQYGLDLGYGRPNARERGRVPKETSGKSAEELAFEAASSMNLIAPADEARRRAAFEREKETGSKTQLEYFQELARKQKDAGTVEASRARRRAEEERRRNQPKTGIAGALEQAKPLGGLALRLAEVLGRGAGASKGFEGAKILEESSRLRSEEAKMQLSRDQIAATTGQSAARAAATSNTALMKLIFDYQNDPAYITALAAKAKEMNLDKTDSRVAQAVMEAYIANLKNVQGMLGGGIGSMQGLGGGEGGGLSEDVASAQAYLAETS